MSDHDAPDPIDQAYVRAEGMLDDGASRSARRARVLGAVAVQPALAPALEKSRPGRGRGGWLMAACVAGFAAVLAFQLSPTGEIRREASPAARPAVETPASIVDEQPPSQLADPPAPAPTSPPPATELAERTQAAPPPPATAPAAPPAVSSPPPPPPMPAPASRAAPEARAAMAPAPPPPMAFPASPESADVVVTGRRAEVAPSAGRSASAGLESAPAASPAVLGARLRSAAAAGRTAELTALLAQGAPVDGADSRGETALMMSVQANHPAAAALLRRYGASLDVKNRAGASAREMAASIDDPDLNRALGIAP